MKRITGVLRDYAWGSLTDIPRILGTEPSGTPQAEYWLGAHPLAPSDADGRPLDDLISDHPDLLGDRCRTAFGDRLPFLMKLLAAAHPLSLQAHPSRRQAEAGFAAEERLGIPRDHPERNYRDDWPKPELLCALTDFDALYGLRDPERTRELFAALGGTGADDLLAGLDGPGEPADRLREVFLSLLKQPRPGLTERVTAAARRRLAHPGGAPRDVDRFAETAVRLATDRPGDPGILAALLMNRLTLHRHEALFVPAGMMHAYLRGTGVEVMATSDNVLRCGLTAKHIDIDALVDVVDFAPADPVRVTAAPVVPGLWHYRTEAREFAVWRTGGLTSPVDLPAAGRPRIVLAVDGPVALAGGGGPVDLPQGRAVLVSAEERVRVGGPGVAFIASSGV